MPIGTEGSVATLKGKRSELQVVSAAPAGAKVSTGKAIIDFVSIKPDAAKVQELFVTVLCPTTGGAAPAVKYSADGKLSVGGDVLVFGPGSFGWQLKSVNGEDATRIGPGENWTMTAFRTGGAVAAKPEAASSKPVATPAAAPAPALAALAVDTKALEVWRGRLRERVVAAVQGGAQPAARLGLVGPEPTLVKILKADAKGFTAQVGGGTLPVPWEQLGAKDYLSLAQSCAKDGDGFSQALLGVFLIADGRASDGDGELAKALLSDPQAASWVEEARALLKR
jgi:hypothetical protein